MAGKLGWFSMLIAASAAALAVPATTPVPAASTRAAAPEPARIHVVGDNNYPPYLFVDAAGKLEGYEVEIWRLFEQHTGIQVELTPMDWASAQRALLAGQADVIDLIYRTPRREALYDFSLPYATLPVGIYVDKRINGVHDAASLHGLLVGVEHGDACAEKLHALGIGELREYPKYVDVVQAAARGDVRIFCMDENPANYFLYQAKALNRFNRAFVLYDGQLHYAVRKGNDALLALVQRGMARITPAERAAARERWLEQPFILAPYLRYLRMAGIALAAVLALVALMALWVWLLRRTVRARTRALREEEGKLRALFDASPDAMTVKDRQGAYLNCNESAARLFGMDRTALLGRTDRELFAPERATTAAAVDDEVMQTGELRTYQLRDQGADGVARDYEVVKVPLYGDGGAVRGVLSVARDITERLRSEEQLRLWAHAFEHAAFGMVIFDAQERRIAAVNRTFARERGYTPDEMKGLPANTLYPTDLHAERDQARQLIDQQQHVLLETEQVARDGRRFPVRLDCSVIHDTDGRAKHVIAYVQDITEQKHADSELRLAAAAFQTQEAMLVTDAVGCIQRVNKALLKFTGYTAEELIGQPVALLTSQRHDQTAPESLFEKACADGLWQGERWIRVKRGQPRVVRSTLSAVKAADGAISHFVLAMIDLTSEREAHASVDHMTFFDPLTDLPNRHFLHGRLQHLLDKDDSDGGALLMIDLDHFKRINDLRGHAAGDRLLALVAQRLRLLLREEWGWLLGRFSGGTFVVMLECGAASHPARAEHARDGAERIRQVLREPFRIDEGQPVTVTASIGWTELVAGQGSPETVLKEAELAMYAAKSAGRDQVRWFEPAMQAALARSEALANDLRYAIDEEMLYLHLQAQVHRSGKITGAEVLLRWTRPCGEVVSPDVFIGIAEETGLILPLGDWVLRHACTLLASWAGQAPLRELDLAVNVSTRQFAQAGFVDGVRRILASSGADPARLKLEITESVVMGDLDEAAFKLDQLRGLGLRISLDDFGTGYSSLAYLSRLPLDQLKIDHSFVARLPEDHNDAMVAQTIVAMGHGLGMEVIAEGVEFAAQRDLLLAQGCDAFQGYLYARPLPVAAFEAMLKDAVRA